MIMKMRAILPVLTLVAATLVSGCAKPTGEQIADGTIADPHEQRNRSVHEFNRGVDRFAFRPAAKGYVAIVPPDMVTSFGLFAENLSMPGQAVNSVLQGNFKQAGIALSRFAINSILGIGGLGDPASDFNVPRVDTNFGETLHVWGVGEGTYVELPFFGPSTARDATGLVVDFFTNPIGYAKNNPADNIDVYAEIVRRLGDRGTYSDTVDSILYESADSYAQARLIYLQNRRFELGQASENAEIDPFELSTEGF